MIRLACLTALAIAFTTAAADKPDPKADLAAIKGRWKVTATTFDGMAQPKPAAGERVLEFGDKEFTAYDGDKKGRTISFTIDATATPKRFDLIRPGKDEKAAGVYKLDGDKLNICYAEPGAARPDKLESKAGARVFLLELERVKK